MSRLIRRLVPPTAALLAALATAAGADIYRWDNGDVIPGTEGIEPGPGAQLDHWELEYAQLQVGSSPTDLSDSNFAFSDLSHSRFQLCNPECVSSDLSRANLMETNLADANLAVTRLSEANLSGAMVGGASFGGTASKGFTKEQLYSTASYQEKELSRIALWYNDLSGWDFHEQNLAGANLVVSNLTNADLSGANLAGASLGSSTLTSANLNGAVVTGAYFGDSTSRGFTKEQLYSTANFEERNLSGIGLFANDLSGWDFHDQNMANAELSFSTFAGANLRGAVVTGASFNDTTSRGFSKEQLYSTASYQEQNLSGIALWSNNILPQLNLEFSLVGVSITSDEGGFDESRGQRLFTA